MSRDISEVLQKIEELRHMVEELEPDRKKDPNRGIIPSPLTPGTYQP